MARKHGRKNHDAWFKAWLQRHAESTDRMLLPNPGPGEAIWVKNYTGENRKFGERQR